MNVRKQHKFLVVLILCFFISSNSFGVFATKIKDSTLAVQTEHVFTLLDELPINIDELFCLDNFTEFEEMLDSIEDGEGFWPIRPYGTFFGHSHIEGLPRMDFCPHRLHVEIRAPLDGIGTELGTINGTADWVKGIEVIRDTGLTLDIGNKCALHFGHIDMVKTIFDDIQASGSVNLTKGELLGFTQTAIGSLSYVDFAYTYNNVNIPPYNAYTPKLQGTVDALYDFIFERAKLNGLFPRANLINDMFIHKDNEFWGNWQYKTGPFDSYVGDEWIGLHDFGFYTFLNREFTTSETFWKNEFDTDYNLTNDIIGYGGSPYYPGWTPGYYPVSTGHILLAQGDNSTGIFELRRQYESSTESAFGRFEIIVNSTSIIGDELLIEFFPTLIEAQSGFTENVSTYERVRFTTIDDLWFPPTEQGSIFILPTVISTIIVLIILRKKKR